MSSVQSIHRDLVSAWNRRDFSAIRAMCHREYTYTGSDGKKLTGGPDIAVAISRMFTDALPDGTLEIKRVYVDGITAVAEMTGRGTRNGDFTGAAPAGRRMQADVCNVIELRDGKVYREREYIDMWTIFSQIGVITLPEQTKTA